MQKKKTLEHCEENGRLPGKPEKVPEKKALNEVSTRSAL